MCFRVPKNPLLANDFTLTCDKRLALRIIVTCYISTKNTKYKAMKKLKFIEKKLSRANVHPIVTFCTTQTTASKHREINFSGCLYYRKYLCI